MSKLLGTKLTMENVDKRSLSQASPISSMPMRQFLCRRCQQTFVHYDGIKILPGGLGLCKQHNPSFKP